MLLSRRRPGRAFLAAVSERFADADPAQRVLLERAAALVDRLDHLERDVSTIGMLVPGSMGQWRGNPLLEEHRRDLAALRELLGVLFDEDVAVASPASLRGRRAAEKRWLREVTP